MSGPYALAAAARYPDRIAAAASFYGTWLVSEAEESPHLSLGKVKGELYIACAEHDKLAPLPMVEELRTLFARAGTAGEIELVSRRSSRFRVPATLVLRQAGRGAPLGAADRALPTTLGVGSAVSPLLRARFSCRWGSSGVPTGGGRTQRAGTRGVISKRRGRRLCHGNGVRSRKVGDRTEFHATATASCHRAAASALKMRRVDRETRCR